MAPSPAIACEDAHSQSKQRERRNARWRPNAQRHVHKDVPDKALWDSLQRLVDFDRWS